MLPHIPDAVTTFLMQADLGEVISAAQLSGGVINKAYRLRTSSQNSVILKQNTDLSDRLFVCEADGLNRLRSVGVRTPEVLTVGLDFLLLEDLGSQTDHETDWEAFGRAVAHQHLHHSERFGYDHDNFLGPLPQVNTWTDDGHEFFGQHRVLRYLSEPLCEQALTPQDRDNVEQLVKRLPDLIPAQPPSLLHGDLWHTNMMVDQQGKPALIDPAVYYGWPEAELSMTYQYGKVSPVFYEAYNEVNPLENGWQERLPLLSIRQHMAVLAFFGNIFNTLDELRDVFVRFG